MHFSMVELRIKSSGGIDGIVGCSSPGTLYPGPVLPQCGKRVLRTSVACEMVMPRDAGVSDLGDADLPSKRTPSITA